MSISQLFLAINSHLTRCADFSEHLDYFDPYSVAALDFSEYGLKIKQILESVYTDGITGLDNIEVKGQNIVGTFSDYISPALTNTFSFEITPENVGYALQSDTNISFSSDTQTKADRNGKIRSCTPGKTFACGARCQAIGTPCNNQGLSENLQKIQAEIVNSKHTAKTEGITDSKIDQKSAASKINSGDIQLSDPRFHIVDDKKSLRQLSQPWEETLAIMTARTAGKFWGLEQSLKVTQSAIEASTNKISEYQKAINRSDADLNADQAKYVRDTYGNTPESLKKAESALLTPEKLEKDRNSTRSRLQSRIDDEHTKIVELKDDYQRLNLDLEDKNKNHAERKSKFDSYGLGQVSEEKIDDSANISRAVLQFINSSNSKVVGVVDSKGNLQASFSYTANKQGVHIDYLASSPWNLMSGHPNQTKGAGTSAIEAAIHLSHKSGGKGRVGLDALPNAVPFYEKMGFKRKNIGEIGLPEMVLSSKDSEILLQKLGSKHNV